MNMGDTRQAIDALHDVREENLVFRLRFFVLELHPCDKFDRVR